ncbi:MAG: ribonuclease III [Clostridia bacterium]|nr:ribonuclease III [Clostridia bacterium]MDD4376115.1 ribonuclease III [Clostridia bacterium]
MIDKNINEIEKIIKYSFKNKKLLETAITHKSYANDKKDLSVDRYNERLEFLGDAILEHIISIKLYLMLPEEKEGELTQKRARIVREPSLSEVITENGLSPFLRLGRCNKKNGEIIKKAQLADMFEAILGAVYLDGGYEEAERICLLLMAKKIEDEINNIVENTDYKTRLQEEVQKEKDRKISYVVIKEEGPAHDKNFFVIVSINEKKVGEGNGKTKKEAEQKAAKEALESL